MAKQRNKYRIFLSAAEPSGDSHCANLIKALQQTSCDIEFVGIGGEKMISAGCQMLDNIASRAVMTHSAFAHIVRFYKLITRVKSYFKDTKVDLVIVCDSPAYNFHIAKAAKNANIKTVFYVAPQLWAWAPWRIEKLRKYCHKLLCILPFEENYFSTKGIDATFVGSPLLDEIESNLEENRRKYTDFDPDSVKIALMPGSRPQEINKLWRPMQQVAVALKRKYRQASFIAVAVDEETKHKLKARHTLGFRSDYEIGSVYEAARSCDFTIVASGSATLQVAAAGCPMVVMYQTSKILWHLIGRWLLKTKYLSLVNILADNELVPEFMPYFDSVDPIVEAAHQLISDKEKLERLSSDLIDLVKPLKANASEKTAQIITDILESQ